MSLDSDNDDDDDNSDGKSLKRSQHLHHKENTNNCQSRPLNFSRDVGTFYSWNLAPNRYIIPLEIYKQWKGQLGAFWPKGTRSEDPKISKRNLPPSKFYDVPTSIGMLFSSCNHCKGRMGMGEFLMNM